MLFHDTPIVPNFRNFLVKFDNNVNAENMNNKEFLVLFKHYFLMGKDTAKTRNGLKSVLANLAPRKQ